MAAKIRTEVNASICAGIHDRMSAPERAGVLRLLEERESDGTTLFNRLKKPAQGPTWSHFKNLSKRLEWVDGLGGTGGWMDGIAAGKITDFAGEADAADVAELRDYQPVKRLALVACLTHKARMRVRDDLATMFCKRVALKIKKAKVELEAIRLAEREIVEALIGNYRTRAQEYRRGRPGPGGAGEGRSDDRRGPGGSGGPGRGGARRGGRAAAGGPGFPGCPRPGQGPGGAGRRVRRGREGGGGLRRVRQAVRADREGCSSSGGRG
jgi:hypothetical protein